MKAAPPPMKAAPRSAGPARGRQITPWAHPPGGQGDHRDRRPGAGGGGGDRRARWHGGLCHVRLVRDTSARRAAAGLADWGPDREAPPGRGRVGVGE
jgi:hypothetical protein